LLLKELKQLYGHTLLERDKNYKEEAAQSFKLVNATQRHYQDRMFRTTNP
jgi:hypothetical protein